MKKREIAVFGGSFDPPTVVHQMIIRTLLDMHRFDEVWVMPSGERMDKPGTTPVSERLAMLALMQQEVFSGDANVKISEFEIGLPQPSETHHTVNALHGAYPDARFSFVFGADSIASMHSWYGGDELLATLPMIAVPRLGYGTPIDARHVHELPDMPIFEKGISSTMVRERVATDRAIGELVCRSVEHYVRRRRMFHEV